MMVGNKLSTHIFIGTEKKRYGKTLTKQGRTIAPLLTKNASNISKKSKHVYQRGQALKNVWYFSYSCCITRR